MPLVRPLFPALTMLLLVVGCTSSAPSTPANSGGAATTATPVVAANRAPASPVVAPSPSLAAPSPSAAAAVPSPSVVASTSAAAAVQGVTVNMTDAFKYEPDNITIPRGATVTWVNTGQSPHTVTDDASKASKASDAALPSGAQPWSSDMINAGTNFQRTFDTPGQYTYFCIPHEALGMVAHITVTP